MVERLVYTEDVGSSTLSSRTIFQMTIDPATFNFEIYPGQLGPVDVLEDQGVYRLFVDGNKWLYYDSSTRQAALELIAHVDLAYGDVVTTGLGLGLREQLLLANPNVSSIRVVEQSQDLIDFHQQNSRWINDPKITVINADANEYTAQCDVLLLDHYEQERIGVIVDSVRKVADNIQCRLLWFWPLESQIIFRSTKRALTLLESYLSLRQDINVAQLPDLTAEQLRHYCRAHNYRLNIK